MSNLDKLRDLNGKLFCKGLHINPNWNKDPLQDRPNFKLKNLNNEQERKKFQAMKDSKTIINKLSGIIRILQTNPSEENQSINNVKSMVHTLTDLFGDEADAFSYVDANMDEELRHMYDRVNDGLDVCTSKVRDYINLVNQKFDIELDFDNIRDNYIG